MSDTHELVLYIQDALFTSIFVADIVLKLLALGPIQYFSKRWNQFDFVIVTSGLVSLFVSGAAVAKILRVTTEHNPVMGGAWLFTSSCRC